MKQIALFASFLVCTTNFAFAQSSLVENSNEILKIFQEHGFIGTTVVDQTRTEVTVSCFTSFKAPAAAALPNCQITDANGTTARILGSEMRVLADEIRTAIGLPPGTNFSPVHVSCISGLAVPSCSVEGQD